jgi:uncharacterized protein (DUF362 family)
MSVTRRSFFARAGAVAAAQGLALQAQQTPAPRPKAPGPGTNYDPHAGTADAAKEFVYFDRRSKVSLIKGENRRKNIYDALLEIDDQIRPGLQAKKYVFVKLNGVDPVGRQLGSTSHDALRGVLDYLAPRFKGPVVVGDSSDFPGKRTVSEFGWDKVFAEYKPVNLSFEVPNEECRHGLMYGMDYDMHVIPVRLGARFLDPEAFVISSSVMKTHNMVVATLSVKNVVMGAPLAVPIGSSISWLQCEKRKFHVGIRAGNYNMFLAAQRMISNWGVGIVDGFEGMEGNGPSQGTPLTPPHRIAVASTDFLAADRVSLECMGIDASWPGYLNYAYQAGLGQFDLAKIDVLGSRIADVKRKYRMHADVDRMLEWRGPMLDLPGNLGRNRPPREEDFSAYA